MGIDKTSSPMRGDVAVAESPVIPADQLAHRRGDYGFDAPYVPIIFVVVGVILAGLTVASFWLFQQPILAVVCLIYAIYMLLSAASYIYTTRVGKFRVWAELLTGLRSVAMSRPPTWAAGVARCC